MKLRFTKSSIALLTGIILFILVKFLAASAGDGTSTVLASAVLMLSWWIGEAAPMPVVALVPLILFPLSGTMKMPEAASAYGNPVIFLFLGGFVLGIAIEKYHLHKRISLHIIKYMGRSAEHLILGFMISTAFISMWISNTATTIMMIPMALSVIKLLEEKYAHIGKSKNFALCLMLSIAYCSSIGGIGTIIGTPPNGVMVAFANTTLHRDISFLQWFLYAFPVAICMILVCYFVLVKLLFPLRISASKIPSAFIDEELEKLGKIGKGEGRVLVIFFITALLWIFRSIINSWMETLHLDDTVIALIASLMLFFVNNGKGEKLLEWKDAARIEWGILLLFGGGLCLAEALEKEGIIPAIGQYISGLGIGSTSLMILVLCFTGLLLTEVMSNVALATVFIPVASGIAISAGIDPLYYCLPVTLSTSFGFMLPMSTPPNAIVFAGGRIGVHQMVRAGFLLNIAGVLLTWLFSILILPYLL